jgi:hypothetical protein
MQFIIWIREKRGTHGSNNAMGRCRFLGQNESQKKFLIYVRLAAPLIFAALSDSGFLSQDPER